MSDELRDLASVASASQDELTNTARSSGVMGTMSMTIALRGLLVLGSSALACAQPTATTAQPTAPVADARHANEASSRAPTTTPAQAIEPADAPAEAPAEPTWRLTTLVTGGPESLIGANGYYELSLDGERATLRKVGEAGTPRYEAGAVLEGSGTLSLAADPAWPSAMSGTLSVILQRGDVRRPITLRVRVLGDEMDGTWSFPSGPGGPPVGRAWGLIAGVRGRGEPIVLTDGDRAACDVCVEAYYNCGGMGVGGCNSSEVAADECDARMAKARRSSSAEPPRGC